MVFLGGPRQVGKTTLGFHLLSSKKSYLNWDVPEHRESILRREFPRGNPILFDEIHKYRSWRNYLKGLYDNPDFGRQILVTGSARLDLYRYGGDSLQGRHYYYRLHPLSFAELRMKTKADLFGLLELGGFPEQFLNTSRVDSKRWSNDYRTRLIRDDLRSLESLQDLGNIELMMLRLPSLVGAPLSLNAIREDLQVSHHSVRRWLDALERLYAFFRLPPFGSPKIRAVKKEQKHYHFDWTLVQEPGLRFENMVACHLLKWTHFLHDTEGQNLELRYFRDIDKREVDFAVLEDSSPILFLECKWADEKLHPGLLYLKERFPKTRSVQIAAQGSRDVVHASGVEIMPAERFLATLV